MRFDKSTAQTSTTTHEGAKAFELTSHRRLLNAVVCSFLTKQYYKSSTDQMLEIGDAAREVAKREPEFVLQVAAWARLKGNMRSAPILLFVIAANIPACKPFVRQYGPLVIRRADEIREVFACQKEMFGKPIPNCIKKSLADAFLRFTPYQLDKYNQDTEYAFKHVLRMVRPSPVTTAQSAIFKFLVHGWDKLTPSERGSLPFIQAKRKFSALPTFDFKNGTAELIKKYNLSWEDVISKFPTAWEYINFSYMAGLRNIRNLINKASKDKVREVCDMVRDPERVATGKQLPFRYYTAWKQLQNDNVVGPGLGFVGDALEEALEHSIHNLNLPGSTCVICDVSGSMSQKLSDRSIMNLKDIGLLFGSSLARLSKDNTMFVFGTQHRQVGVKPSVLLTTQEAERIDVQNGTVLAPVFEDMVKRRLKFDRVVLLSDMQVWGATFRFGWFSHSGGADAGGSADAVRKAWQQYRNEVAPEATLYSIDMASYGNSQFPEGDGSVVQLAGWSDQVLKFIEMHESNEGSFMASVRGIRSGGDK